MKIEEQTKVEIQQALGYAVPDPSAPGFAAFYSRLETEHPELAAQLLAGLQHDEGEGGTDSQALFPEQEAQARTRAQARNVLQRLFYRQDDLTDEWTVSKGKVGMAGLLGACLLMGPMLLAGAGAGGGKAPAPVPAKVAQTPVPQTLPPEPPAAPVPPPVAEAPVDTAAVAPPPSEPALPPITEAVPAAPSEPAPVAVAPPVAQAVPVYDPAPVPAQAAAPPSPPPIGPGATVFKAVRATANTSTTVYVSAARSGTPEGGGKEGAAKDGGFAVYEAKEDAPPNVQFSVFDANKPEVPAPAAPQTPGSAPSAGQTPGPQTPGAVANQPAGAGSSPATGRPGGGTEAPAAPAAPPLPKATAAFPVGTTLKAELSTGVIVAQGSQSMPVLARTDSGVIFSGLATLGAAGRLSIVFNNVLINGKLETLTARAYDPGGLPGLPVRLREVAPSLAVDLTRAAASGVAGYVEQLGNQTETVIEGNTKTVISIPPTLSNVIAGAVAKLFAAPPTQKALERIAQVDRGTPMLITVMGEGAPEVASKP